MARGNNVCGMKTGNAAIFFIDCPDLRTFENGQKTKHFAYCHTDDIVDKDMLPEYGEVNTPKSFANFRLTLNSSSDVDRNRGCDIATNVHHRENHIARTANNFPKCGNEIKKDVNPIRVAENSRLRGYHTDCQAAPAVGRAVHGCGAIC